LTHAKQRDPEDEIRYGAGACTKRLLDEHQQLKRAESPSRRDEHLGVATRAPASAESWFAPALRSPSE